MSGKNLSEYMENMIFLQDILDEFGQDKFLQNIKLGGTQDSLVLFLLQIRDGDKQCHWANRAYYETGIPIHTICKRLGIDTERQLQSFVGPYELWANCSACDRPLTVFSREEHIASWFKDDITLFNDTTKYCKHCNPPADEYAFDGFVYLLESGGVYKIGVTKNLNRRVKQISPKMPYPVNLIHSIKTNDRYKLEGWLHNIFRSKRLEGEWFQLSETDVQIIKSMGNTEL